MTFPFLNSSKAIYSVSLVSPQQTIPNERNFEDQSRTLSEQRAFVGAIYTILKFSFPELRNNLVIAI